MKNLLTSDKSWAVRKRAFSIWQQTPYKLAEQSEVLHTCQSCGTEFQGNYCPRCGQSSRIGRFSFKTAFMLFLDVWGIGNRGMFHSIRDLLLRPGYMIRDYVEGHQSAYFPPFKMFFILATFSLLLSHGLDLGLNEQQSNAANKVEPNEITTNDKPVTDKTMNTFMNIPKVLGAFEKKNPSLFGFMILVLVSAPLYLFFRRCPAIPDLRYSEHLVALVYTSNMYSIYQILSSLNLFGLSGLIKLLALIMIFVALKQFTGYSQRRLLLYIVLTSIICMICVIILAVLFAAII